ncbi:M50 family metallopeptidase [Anaerobacillus alkalidiazotrophicus]|uniref:M50 family metallopeptidase n=1 Tax=Anaerobacillus alkalidiazotrophicus TaxID=472963 RepID=UPI001470FBF5|nr:M50 family metallopeptidase [Anaerobacillus alkalidiazotrophicus]
MEHIFYYLVAAFVICHIPIIRRLFCTINTLVHESGHAIAALMTSGKVYSVSLYLNSEGLAEVGTRSWLSRVIVSYAGYTTSSVVAFLCFYFINSNNLVFIFYGLLALAIINLVLWVRNFFGILWLCVFIGFSFYIEYHQLLALKEALILLSSSIILIHSVSSAFTIFYLSIFHPSRAGDATSLASNTFIPTILWGFIFFVQSLISLYYVFTLFIL